MHRDIDAIIERIQREYPAVEVEQLRVKFIADDDGIWFFKHRDCHFEVQLESSSGNCPFIVETDEHDGCEHANGIDEAVEILRRWLHLEL